MPTFEVEFEVYCSCGEDLCNQSITSLTRQGLIVKVDPCEKCLRKAQDDGWETGHKNGYEQGYDKGYTKFSTS